MSNEQEMTDKETLILAAKAMHGDFAEQMIDAGWNSIDSNDDCFRMETALGLNVTWHVYADSQSQTRDAVQVDNAIEKYADHNGDKDKARRYASTRAAALIGRE